jgi:D-arabinose 1-dehydrogenase-like Zn-dependent alcohol dehydrogenase
MLAARVSSSGLELEQVRDPTPGPGEILVRVLASGVGWMDVRQVAGEMGTRPRTPGHEFVGEVVDIGRDVDDARVGTVVGTTWHQRWCGRCDHCTRGRVELCKSAVETGIYVDGGHAELALIHGASAVPIPDSLDALQAAPLMSAGYAAYSAIVDAHAGAGKTVGIMGIGGVGHLAVQYGIACGSSVMAITSTPSKSGDLEALGAQVVPGDADDDAIAQLRSDGGLDALVITRRDVPGDLGPWLETLKPYGRVIVVAATTQPVAFVPQRLLHYKLTLRGASQGPRDRLAECLALHTSGRARVHVKTFALTEAPRAFDAVAAGTVRYRAVLVP